MRCGDDAEKEQKKDRQPRVCAKPVQTSSWVSQCLWGSARGNDQLALRELAARANSLYMQGKKGNRIVPQKAACTAD